jgi:hypothetical protein
MLKIIQVKETLEDGKLQDNIYDIEATTKKIIKKLDAINELNYIDYNFISIILEQANKSLQKAYAVMKI